MIMQPSSNTSLRPDFIRLLRTALLVAVFAFSLSCRVNPQPPVPGAYGPYSINFLTGGPGVAKNIVTGDAILKPGAHFSLSFWFRSSQVMPGPVLLAGIGAPGARDGRFVAWSDNHLVLWTSTPCPAVASAPLDPARWHQALLSSDGAKLSLFADGELVARCPTPSGEALPVLAVGPRSSQTDAFGGQIAYLSLNREAVTAAEEANLWTHAPDVSLPTYEDAAAHWPLQTHAQSGCSVPQDPSTLPHSKSEPQRPIAASQHSGDLQTHLQGSNPWTITGGWKLSAAPDVPTGGTAISAVGYNTVGWYDATVPGTVLTTLIDRGVYPDPDYGLNNLAIPETLAHQDYWYRVEFNAPQEFAKQRLTLTFEGINYAAEVWLNGEKLGSTAGAFLRGRFDVTDHLRLGAANALAVLIAPPPHPGIAHEQSMTAGPGENGGVQVIDGPTFSATEGWDWIPGIRDRNTGIWQDVTLAASGPITISDLNVITTLPKEDRSEADVEIEVPLSNTASQTIEGDLTASFDDVEVIQHILLPPGSSTIRLTPAQYMQLRVMKPRLWWPNGYGEPTLHHLQVSFSSHGVVSDRQSIDFGMREVSYELSLFDTAGNLRRVEVLPARTHDAMLPLIDGSHAGIRQIVDQSPDLPAATVPDSSYAAEHRTWVYSLTPEGENSPSVRAATPWPGTDLTIKVNGIRIAARGGNWGMDDSRKRVSIERLEPYFRLHRDAHLNIIRNWMGQDTEEAFYKLADKYGLMVWNDFWESTQDYNLEAEDPALFLGNARDTILRFRHHPSIVVWCGRNEGVPQPILNEGLADLVRSLDHTRYYTGSSNRIDLRDSGPYQLLPLASYYRINRGFSVELGIPSVPTLEGMKAFIPQADRWPISDTWAYHDWHQKGGGAVAPYLQYMDTAFGPASSLQDFERKAQMIDYAAHRAIFEGFAAHLWQPNSGRLLWMTQPAWPSLEWNILGSDYDTQSSFYGVQKACEPVHAQLDLSDGTVDLINLGETANYSVRIKVVRLNGAVINDETRSITAAEDNRTHVSAVPLAQLAGGHTILIQLQAQDSAGKVVSNNLYWWAEKDESLREMNVLPPVGVAATAKVSNDGIEQLLTVKLANTSSLPALMVKLTLKDARTGERILPAYYSDNYLSLLPGEQRTITTRFRANGATPSLELRGWNLPGSTVVPVVSAE